MISTAQYGEVLQIRVCRYPDFPSAMWVCSYLVDGLLIDTGIAHTAKEFTAFLKDKYLKKAVNTHFHEDHVSANKFLQDEYGIEIFAHPLSVNKINKPATLYPYQEAVWGYPVPSEVKPLGSYIYSENYSFEVIPTPGHDRGHICLFEKSHGWLFSGDLYINTKPKVCRPSDDMWQILADLENIRSLNPQVLFPAPTHVVYEPAAKLDELIARLEELGGEIVALHQKGKSVERIKEEIFGPEDMFAQMTQQQFSSLNMVKSFLKNHLVS
ncbi:MAG TPA: MBL fold metallo-hydrolase [Smithellaceae bacterium]|nr:MBL fold metallo-hydrolase [Smithellaceae bacterium]HOS08475.1 MBL fold metallo-hydrolase [Smithellaceae bacterium]HPD49086.1 MBL fold metallo-hydrolase [Smithellaceae bacterium]HPL49394.1 MBL fold metallo-hydrolase [Smithellaceae bacterium]HQG24287.1 MBL fold metallo-hydrolase [Smithellaceae bacterium]